MIRARTIGFCAICRVSAALLCLSPILQADAQSATSLDQGGEPAAPPQSQVEPQAGRIAKSSAGEIGQRRTREQAEGIKPMARISTRIPNRVQSRIRNRIDRDYDPEADAASPFATAQDQVRAAGRTR